MEVAVRGRERQPRVHQHALRPQQVRHEPGLADQAQPAAQRAPGRHVGRGRQLEPEQLAGRCDDGVHWLELGDDAPLEQPTWALRKHRRRPQRALLSDERPHSSLVLEDGHIGGVEAVAREQLRGQEVAPLAVRPRRFDLRAALGQRLAQAGGREGQQLVHCGLRCLACRTTPSTWSSSAPATSSAARSPRRSSPARRPAGRCASRRAAPRRSRGAPPSPKRSSSWVS